MARLQDDPQQPVEQFHPTSGRATGWMTVVVAAAVVVAGLAYLDEGFPSWVIGAALLVGVAAWAAEAPNPAALRETRAESRRDRMRMGPHCPLGRDLTRTRRHRAG